MVNISGGEQGPSPRLRDWQWGLRFSRYILLLCKCMWSVLSVKGVDAVGESV